MSVEKREYSRPARYGTDRRGPIRWVVSHAIRQWPLLCTGLLGAVGNAATAAVAPTLIGDAFSCVTADTPDRRLLLWLALVIALSQLARVALQFMRGASFELIAQRIERNIREELYADLLGKSMTFHSLQPVGDTMARATNDVREVNFLFSPGVNWVVGSMMFLAAPVVLAFRYHPQLVLTPAAFVLLYAVALKLYLRALSRPTEQVRRTFGELNTRLSEALDGVELIKGTACETAEEARFTATTRAYREACVSQGDVEARFMPMLLLVFALAGGLFHALVLHRQGLLNLGQVVGYFGTLLLLDFPTFASLFAYSRVSLGLAGARRILDLMQQRSDLDQNLAGHRAPLRGELCFDHATFAYDGASPTLEDVSFRLEAGQTLAVVGQTGSGKSTLAKLVNRIHDTTAGTVRVDGVNVRDWNLEALRQGISIIEQDVFLFSRSIAENIAFGRPAATRAEVEQAARAAQAHDFILTFEDGYDTVVGERGVTLSGGQRQRLALARAFLTDPKILILDDSTSAIDSATEDEIQKAIFAASRGRTTLIITHRLSQIRWADRILVLRKGRAEAFGTHDDLMRTSAAYRRIFTE